MHRQAGRVRDERALRIGKARAQGLGNGRVVRDRDRRVAGLSVGALRVGALPACALLACALLAPALPAAAVPGSLRSVEDVRDVADLFLRTVAAGDVTAAYRNLVTFWPAPAQRRASEILGAERRRGERRRRLGLSLGAEWVTSEAAGERVLRLTYFERLDRGGIVWRLIFFKPESVWLLHSVSQTEDLAALFGPVTEPSLAPEPASTPTAAEGSEPASEGDPDSGSDSASGSDAESESDAAPGSRRSSQ